MYHVDMNHFLELRKQIFINETFITLEAGEENKLTKTRPCQFNCIFTKKCVKFKEIY